LGANSRALAVREFSTELVVAQTLQVYQRLLGKRWGNLQTSR
jgi:hypothetical protein